MASDHMIRASDRDRDAVAATLRDAYAAGRLTLTELTERVDQTFASRTWGELRALTRDLPEQPHLGADLPNPPPVPAAPGNPVPRGTGPPSTGPPGTGPPSTGPHSTVPGRTGPRPRPERPRGWPTPVVPFVMVWLLIVLVTRSGGSIAVPVVVVALVLLFTSLSGRN
jgi:hypothetical protein